MKSNKDREWNYEYDADKESCTYTHYTLDKTVEDALILSSGEDFNIYGEERISTESEEERLTYIGSLNQSVMQNVKDDLKAEEPKQTVTSLEYDDNGNTVDIQKGFGYNGERLDETGNIYLRARYYNPRIGQFVQIDSNRGTQEQIDTQQRYTYCANNQYKYVDPNGNFFGFIKSAINTVVKTAKKVVTTIVNVGKKIVNVVVDAAKNVINSITHKTKTSETIKKNVPKVVDKTENGNGKNITSHTNKASNSKAKALEPESCPFKDFLSKHGQGILDAIQFVIDFAGMLLPPGASSVLDIANALIYLLRDKPIDFIVSVASVVIVAVGGYIFKTLKATGKFDKVIEGIVKIKSNAKQLITNGLTKANNFIQGITIPFTGWIKDAFGSIISKAKGFVVDVFNKYAPKHITPEGITVQYTQIKNEVVDKVTEKIPTFSSEKAIKEYWKSLADQLRKQGLDVMGWNRGSFQDVYDSVACHYTKHAKEVGATSVQQYLRKANEFKRNLKRASKHKVSGYVQDVTRYSKNGFYIDLDSNKSIISYGRTGK